MFGPIFACAAGAITGICGLSVLEQPFKVGIIILICGVIGLVIDSAGKNDN